MTAENIPATAHFDFHDIDELTEFVQVQGWNSEYLQLQKGRAKWEIFHVWIGEAQLAELHYGAPFLWQGAIPKDTFSLAIPTYLEKEAFYGGNPVTQENCYAASCSQQLDTRANGQFETYVLSVPRDRILAFAEQIQVSLTAEQLLSLQGVILVTHPPSLGQLHAYVKEVLTLAKTDPDWLMDQSQGNSRPQLILEDLLPLLVNFLTTDPDLAPEKESNQRTLFKQAKALMQQGMTHPITLTELCQGLDKSQRSLYYAFQNYVGLPPMEFLKLLRLHVVRRELRLADPQTETVTTISGRYGGFWHMGQFSKDYKQMFGESPSATLRNKKS